jgi:hypothetical protein
LWKRDGGSCRDDLGRRKSGIFLQTGLDRLMGDLPDGQIGASPFAMGRFWRSVYGRWPENA